MKTRFAFMVILFSLLSCQRDIASCDCKQVDVYGILHDITFILRISEDDIRKGGIATQIYDAQQIESIKNFALNLELLDIDYNGIDVKVVLDLICSNGGKITILLNNYLAKIGNSYYKVDSEKLDELNLESI